MWTATSSRSLPFGPKSTNGFVDCEDDRKMSQGKKHKSDDSLFNIGSELEEKLRLPSAGAADDDACVSVSITPLPGFCVKTRKADSAEKVFLNFCTSDQIGRPKDISASELRRVLNEEDVGSFRVPMSLGPSHTELDKSGKACCAHDIIVHPSFCDKVLKDEAFLGFLISASVQGLEEKYGVKLDIDSCVVLKNKRHMGALETQQVRKRAKPFVVEMDSKLPEGSPARKMTGNNNLVSEIATSSDGEVKTGLPKPNYIVAVEPSSGTPEHIVVEVFLRGVKSSKTVTLDVGEDRLVVRAHPDKYYLALDLPHWVHPQQGGSQFNRRTQILCITLPVQEGESR